MFVAHGVTHPGKVRKTNEDGFLVDPGLGLVAVADGLGGHNAGEVASSLALETMQRFLAKSRGGSDFTWPYGIVPTLSLEGNRLATSIKLANRRVVKAGESREDYAGLGTTVVAMLFTEDEVSFAGVGDSRIYLVRDGRAEQITEDDSWAAIAAKTDPGHAQVSPSMRNVLTSVIGAREALEVDVIERDLEPGDAFLLCSDGLHNSVDLDTIARQLGSAEPPEAAADALVRLALERDGSDNITAVVVRWPGEARS